MKSCRSRIAFAVAALALAVAGVADAAELKVYSSLVFGEIWAELKPKIEARGHKLELVLLPSGAVTKRVTEGEAVDVIVTTAPAIDGLAKSGKLAPDTTRAVASVGIGVAVLKGAPRPDISTPEAFRNALLAAKSVAYSDPAGGGASGIAFAKVLKDLGIAEAVNAKARLGRGVPNAEFVVKGEAELAVQQIPELMTVSGVDVIPFPPALQVVTRYATAVHATSANPAAAKALVELLVSPETFALLKARGFDASP